MKWQYLSDIELLNRPVKSLELSIQTPYIQMHIQKLRKELKARNIDFPVEFWLGDEWCSPEGSPGVSIPFGLAHPRLARLERKFVGFLEGSHSEQFMKLMRHEVGHALETAFGIDRHPLRELMFGSTDKKYPADYKPNKNSRDFVRHLPDHYAQAHPDEDFAETFAVWLTPKSQWIKKYKNWPVMDKLKVMDMLMQDVSEMHPVRRKVRQSYHYKKLNITLMDYYRQRFSHYNPHLKITKKQLNRLFTVQPKGPRASDWLSENQHYLKKKMKGRLRSCNSDVGKSMADLHYLANKWNLHLKPIKLKKPKEVLDFVVQFSIQSSQRDYTRIIM